MTELQLQTGPYRTTFVGTEIMRPSTPDEWRNYGEILKRVDEAKQWAIGDWLVDGMRHFEEERGQNKKHGGTGLYKEAERILEQSRQHLEKQKYISDIFKFTLRSVNLSWNHHYEVASVKKIAEDKKGKLYLSDEADEEKIQELLAKAEKKSLSVRDLRETVKQYKRQQQETIRLANEPEKYPIVYADPPWKYSDELIEGYGAVVHHYPPMSIQELCDLPVRKRVSDEAVLFLWVTSPMLDECWPVIKAWGFEYKTSFVWDKVRHNYGHYNSVRHELLLICTRGSFLPESNELEDSVIEVERNNEHSEKPEYFRELIDRLYPTGKRIELFARGEVPEHWDAWGDEQGNLSALS